MAAIISPWNFPLAICCGMTTAALAVGNTAVVKPSTQTRGIAQAMCEILWQAGVPADVLQFLPGAGRAIGDLLVRDPRVAMIAFTGSKEVGLGILRAAGDTPEGQTLRQESRLRDGRQECHHRRRFGRPGRGRAGRPAIGLRLLRPEVLGLQPGDRAGGRLRPVPRAAGRIDPHAGDRRSGRPGDRPRPGDRRRAPRPRSAEYIEIGKSEGRLELACEVPAGLAERVGKPYVGPHIFSRIRPHHRLANEEIFGPVLVGDARGQL